jgi:hypothetical protein
VIATGFDKQGVATAAAAVNTTMPIVQPRYVQRPVDDSPRPMMGQRSDDLDVPTFIRKKAD